MRWFWIDRFSEFVSGSHATAGKSVSLSEDHLHDHFPGYPVMPQSLIVEGIAQTSGLLVSEYFGFSELVVLAKVTRSEFHRVARPGDTLTYRVKIDSINSGGAIVSGTADVAGAPQANVDLVFARMQENAQANGRRLFRPQDLNHWLHLVGVFDVGKHQDGSPLRVEDYDFGENLSHTEARRTTAR